MSLLEFIKYNDDRQNFELIIFCAMMIHVSRFASMYALCYDIACKCNSNSSAKAREISLKTQLIYIIIYVLEVVGCFKEKTTTFIKLSTIAMLETYVLMIMIIFVGRYILKNREDIDDNFSWYFMILLFIGSYVLAKFFILDGKETIIIFNSCLNVFALLPQFSLLHKVKTVRLSVRLYLFGMVIQTCFMIPGAIDMIRVLGFEAEYHQLIFIGASLLATFICFLTLYPWKVVASDDNQQNREVQINEEVIELTNLPPVVVIHEEQRETTIAAGNDNKSNGEKKKQDVTETTKMIDPHPDIVDQQSHLRDANASAGATKENEQAGHNEENLCLQETSM